MKITSSKRAYHWLKLKMDLEVEEFWVIGLKPDKTPLNSKLLFRGTVDSCLVHPRDIFRFACRSNSSSVIIAHSHPSGDPTPSRHDILITRNLVQASKFMEIPINDHLIICHGCYWSFTDRGMLN